MQPVSTAEPRRLSRLATLQFVIAGAFSLLVGGITTVQFCFGLAKFGGLEYAPRVTLMSSVRVLGPATSASAMLVALLVWTHRLDADTTRPALLRGAPRAVLVAIVSIPLATVLAFSSGFFVAHWGYGVPWHTIATSRTVLTFADIPAAIETFVVSVVLATVSCWFALPTLTRRSWSLVQKIGATWAVAILLRIIVAVANAVAQTGRGIGP